MATHRADSTGSIVVFRHPADTIGHPIRGRLTCGPHAVMPEFVEPAKIALTVTSPPYDGIRDYTGEWSADLPSLGRNLFDLTMDGGVAAVVIQDGTVGGAKTATTAHMIVDWLSVGWRLFETIVWHRPGKPGKWWNTRFRVDHEYILLFLKGQRPRVFDKERLKIPAKYAGKTVTGTERQTDGTLKPIREGCVQNPMKCRGTVWTNAAANSERNKIKMEHPATFPDSLVDDLLHCFTKPGDLVVDPFTGSGTTLVRAMANARVAFGTEISSEYCFITKQRVNAELGLRSLWLDPAINGCTP